MKSGFSTYAVIGKFILLLVLLSFGRTAYAVPISGPCGAGDTTLLPGGGFLCVVAGATVSQSGSGTADPNSFLLEISPVQVSTAGLGAGNVWSTFGMGMPFHTGPILASPTTTSRRFVRLDGEVEFFSDDAAITFLLEGWIDGVVDASTGLLIAVEDSCPVGNVCSIADLFGMARFGLSEGVKTANVLDEYLDISILGEARYSASSPVYIGVPEPSSVFLLLLGLLIYSSVRYSGKASV